MATAWAVVEREVQRGARRWQTFAWRMAFAGVLFLAVAAFYEDSLNWRNLYDPEELAWIGRELFEFYTYAQWWLLGLITPVLVSQGIIEERNAKTMELLTISRLKPRQVLLGKVLSALATVYVLMLAGLPIVALCLTFGGVGVDEMANAFLHTAVGVFALGSLAAYFGLFARGPIAPLLLTWNGAFWGWSLCAVPGGIATDRDFGIGWTSIGYAFFEADLGWWTLLPAVVWVGVSLVLLRLAEQVFRTQLVSSGGEDPDAAMLSVDVWGVEKVKTAIGAAVMILVMTAPVLGIAHWAPYSWRWLSEPLGYSLSFVWNVAALITAMTGYCLAVRAVVNWQAQRRGRSVSWKELAEEDDWDHDALITTLTTTVPALSAIDVDNSFDEPIRRSLSGKPLDAEPRRRRKRLPWKRQVWSNPVAWRETVTRAHGFVTNIAGKAYIVGLLIGLLLVSFEAVREEFDAEAMIILTMGGFAVACLVTLMTATSSMVGEQRRGTLALLCATPMSAWRILSGKLMGVAAFVGPVFAVSSILLLLATPWFGTTHRYRWWSSYADLPATEVLVFRWLGVTFIAAAAILVIAAGCMWVAVRARTASRAWMINLLWVAVLAIGPAMVLAIGDGNREVEMVVAWINPVLNEDFWDEDLLPNQSLVSALAWVGIGIGILHHTASTLRQVSAR